MTSNGDGLHGPMTPAMLAEPFRGMAAKHIQAGHLDSKAQHRFCRDLMKVQMEYGAEIRTEVQAKRAVMQTRKGVPSQTVKSYFGESFVYSLKDSLMGVLEQYWPNYLSFSALTRMSRDPMVAFGFGIWRSLLAGADWYIDTNDPGIRRFLTDEMERLFTPLIDKHSHNALKYGCNAMEQVWVPVHKKYEDEEGNVVLDRDLWTIDYYKDLDPQSYTIEVEPKGEMKGILQRDRSTGELLPIGLGPSLFFGNFDAFHGNHYGIPLLMPAWGPYYWKQVFSYMRGRYFERQGSGHLEVGYPEDTDVNYTDDNGKAQTMAADRYALQLGATLVEHAVVAKPNSYNEDGKPHWTIDYKQTDQRGQMWMSLEAAINAEIIRAMLFPDRSIMQDSRAGSSASAVSGRDMFFQIAQAKCNAVEFHINESTIDSLLEFNWSPMTRKPARFRFYPLRLDRIKFAQQSLTEALRQIPNMLALGLVPKLFPHVGLLSDTMGLPVGQLLETFEQFGKSAGATKEERRRQRADTAAEMRVMQWLSQGRGRRRGRRGGRRGR